MNKEDLVPGGCYVIKDSYFKRIRDPYLMKNRKTGPRPNVFLFIDLTDDLGVFAPLSTKKDKYDLIVKRLEAQLSKETDLDKREEISNKLLGLIPSSINGIDGYILLQNMYPINLKYVSRPYLDNKGTIEMLTPNEIDKVINQAKRVCKLLENGFKFMKTQPNYKKIKNIMISQNKISL
ncbi:MAG: hypothetical protein LUD22_04225 [Coprobacillus sp.]|nr:hypothetical protein [Coprobacillus sp.]